MALLFLGRWLWLIVHLHAWRQRRLLTLDNAAVLPAVAAEDNPGVGSRPEGGSRLVVGGSPGGREEDNSPCEWRSIVSLGRKCSNNVRMDMLTLVEAGTVGTW